MASSTGGGAFNTTNVSNVSNMTNFTDIMSSSSSGSAGPTALSPFELFTQQFTLGIELDLIISIALVVVGLIFLVFGARLYKVTLFFFIFFSAGAGVFYGVTLVSGLALVGLIAGAVVGLGLAILCLKWYKIGIVLSGLGAGGIIWLIAKALIPDALVGRQLENAFILYGSLAGMMIIVSLIALKLDKAWWLFGTGVGGSFMFIQGLSGFIPDNVNMFAIIYFHEQGCRNLSCYMLYAGVLVLAIVSVIVQWRVTSRLCKKDEDEEVSDRQGRRQARQSKKKGAKVKRKVLNRGGLAVYERASSNSEKLDSLSSGTSFVVEQVKRDCWLKHKAGWSLVKEGAMEVLNGDEEWETLFFVLEGKEMSYYANQKKAQARKPIKEFSLKGAEVVRLPSKWGPGVGRNALSLRPRKAKPCVVRLSCALQADAWARALQHVPGVLVLVPAGPDGGGRGGGGGRSEDDSASDYSAKDKSDESDNQSDEDDVPVKKVKRGGGKKQRESESSEDTDEEEASDAEGVSKPKKLSKRELKKEKKEREKREKEEERERERQEKEEARVRAEEEKEQERREAEESKDAEKRRKKKKRRETGERERDTKGKKKGKKSKREEYSDESDSDSI